MIMIYYNSPPLEILVAKHVSCTKGSFCPLHVCLLFQSYFGCDLRLYILCIAFVCVYVVFVVGVFVCLVVVVLWVWLEIMPSLGSLAILVAG